MLVLALACSLIGLSANLHSLFLAGDGMFAGLSEGIIAFCGFTGSLLLAGIDMAASSHVLGKRAWLGGFLAIYVISGLPLAMFAPHLKESYLAGLQLCGVVCGLSLIAWAAAFPRGRWLMRVMGLGMLFQTASLFIALEHLF